MGFWGSLFDWRFRHFATPTLVQLIFVMHVVTSAVATIIVDVVTIANLHKYDALPWQSRGDEGWEFGFVLVSPILFVLGIVVVRVFLETLVVIFRIAEALTPPRQ